MELNQEQVSTKQPSTTNFEVGQKVKLVESKKCYWNDHCENADAELVVVDIKLVEHFQTGIGLRVSLPIQPSCSADSFTFYDSSYFEIVDKDNTENVKLKHKQIFDIVNPSLPLQMYDAVEVYPCVNVSEGIERFEPVKHDSNKSEDFWSVALRLETGLAETIADFKDFDQAHIFGKLMNKEVLQVRSAFGLSSPHLEH